MHWLAMALAELGHEVLYVDPPVSPLSLVRQPDRRRDLTGARLEQPLPRFRVWHPLVVPGQNNPAGQRINARVLRSGVRRHLGQPDLVVVSSLEARSVARVLPGVHAYCCIDSFEDLPGVAADAIRSREAELLEAVDVVAACSLLLCEQLRSRGADPILLPHGCDASFLVDLDAIDVPQPLRGLQRPLIGYVGSVNFRIDAALLAAARRATGDGTLVIVGGSFRAAGPRPDAATAALLADPAVVTVGHQEADVLPAFVAALDVGLAPYSDTAFNRKSYPLKVLQYLAAGVPVVSSANGATDDLGDRVHLASGPDEFERAVRDALEEGDRAHRRARQDAAAARPWTLVAEELLAACAPEPMRSR
jgi:teichuronic acid biosynthesis glycosyltransferase TuaH